MTKVMKQGACENNHGSCEMTADELELVSGGDYLGRAASMEGANAGLRSSVGGAIMCAVNAFMAAT